MRAPTIGTPGSPGRGVAGTVVLAAMLLNTGWPVTSGLLLQPGGPLIVSQGELLPSLVVTCDSTPGTPPSFVRISYDWRWSRAEPWPTGDDSVTISWYTRRWDPILGYDLGSIGPVSAGIRESNREIGDPWAIVFAVALATTRFEPSAVEILLATPHDVANDHGSIEIEAIYLHAPDSTAASNALATWRVRSNTRCTW